jgi:hypothetical protein
MRAAAQMKARAFLAAYKNSASITQAAKAARIDRTLHYRWLRRSSGYAAAFERAKPIAAGVLLDRTVKRAIEGTLEPVFYQGQRCGLIRRYPEGTAQFLLRGLMPEVFGAKLTAEVSGPGGAAIEVRPDIAALTDDELATAIALAQKLAGTSGG